MLYIYNTPGCILHAECTQANRRTWSSQPTHRTQLTRTSFILGTMQPTMRGQNSCVSCPTSSPPRPTRIAVLSSFSCPTSTIFSPDCNAAVAAHQIASSGGGPQAEHFPLQFARTPYTLPAEHHQTQHTGQCLPVSPAVASSAHATRGELSDATSGSAAATPEGAHCHSALTRYLCVEE
jgi:hypothetical protein